MKRKLFLIGLLIAALALAGCGAADGGSEPAVDPAQQGPVEPAPDMGKPAAPGEVGYEDAYREVLDEFYTLIGADENAEALLELGGGAGVLEAVRYLDDGSALDRVGYAIEDLSGDGIPELVIGAVMETEGDTGTGSDIYAVYACPDGTAQCTFEGWARNRFFSMADGGFFNLGSAGAAYTIFGAYDLSPDGTELVCRDYYFTYEKDENFSEIGFYHNTDAVWDPAASEELIISEDDFWALEEDLESQVRPMTFTPFSAYQPDVQGQ